MSRVVSSSSASSINIKDSNGNALTSTGGALNVNIGTGGTPISVYNEATGIAMGASQAVITYTVPAGQTLALTRVDVSSDSVATIEVEFDSVVNAKRRIYYTDFNTTFDWSNSQNGYNLVAGTIITIMAVNNSNNGVASVNATLQGILE